MSRTRRALLLAIAAATAPIGTTGPDAEPTYGHEYSLAHEHLAQAPRGSSVVAAHGKTPHGAFLDLELIDPAPDQRPTATTDVPPNAFVESPGADSSA